MAVKRTRGRFKRDTRHGKGMPGGVHKHRKGAKKHRHVR